MVFRIVCLAVVLAASVLLGPNQKANAQDKDIVDTAVGAGQFGTLAAALQAADLVDLAVDKLLPTESGVYGHYANQIDHVEQAFNAIQPGAWVQRQTGLGTGTANGLKRAVDMRASLDMGGDDIGACFGKN